ncbi:MAG: STT3 domain-containing protein [Candidatus Nanoarchaeia archaeon]|nr:hypothetical protein [Candidatus Haiyanarchaeum thermophilum]MCW1303408.1 hypothetical protein [Candidatus Haiyanarchaeum thermophilum]MCW1303905.1 hypothetical protein [Candidatus Haiyanarchaeum thermophilum]MCW1306770.1 hypothetical protein [Candidatus Haiyanarchaeum thermophilum]MCW1307434.1 hypothetical protein [Candidatus Haiyanarchaeum thermophilum]
MEKTEPSELAVDLRSIGKLIKGLLDHGERLLRNKLLKPLLFIIILILAFYTRTLNIPRLNGNLVSMDDPYIFLRYTNYIVDLGYLPRNDTLRYYPMGFDTSSEMLLPSYIAAYFYKFLSFFIPNLDRMTAYYLYTPFLVSLGLIAYAFLLYELFKDWRISLLGVIFLGFSTSILLRSVSGFLEKEPAFLVLGFLSLLFFIKAWREEGWKKSILYSIIASIFTGVSMHAWGGYAFVLITISIFSIAMNVIGKVDKRRTLILIFYTLGVFGFMSFSTTRFGGIKGTLHSLQFLALAFTTGVCIFSQLYRRFIHSKIRIGVEEGIVATLIPALLVLLIGILFNPTYLQLLAFLPNKLLYPMGSSRMAQSISENQPTYFSEILSQFGVGGVPILFLLFYFGSVYFAYKSLKPVEAGKYFAIMFLILISIFLFKRLSPTPSRIGVALSSLDNEIAISITLIAFLAITLFIIQRFKVRDCDENYMFSLIFFTVSLLAAAGAARLIFVLGLSAPIIASTFFVKLEEILAVPLNFLKIREESWKTYWKGASFLIAAVISFALIKQYFDIVPYYGSDMGNWWDASNWIKQNTNENEVFIHWWDYGYWIQYSAGRATVGDPGNYYWLRNYDVGRYLMSGYSKQDYLHVLNKYGRPNYLYIVWEDIGKFYQMARIGERDLYFQFFIPQIPRNLAEYQFIYQQITKSYEWTKNYSIQQMWIFTGFSTFAQDFELNGRNYRDDDTFIRGLVVFMSNESTDAFAIVYNKIYGDEILPLEGICEPNKGCVPESNESVCILRYMTQPPAPHEEVVKVENGIYRVNECVSKPLEGKAPGYVFFTTQAAGCLVPVPIFVQHRAKDTLFAKLYLFNLEVDGFEKVYENTRLVSCIISIGGLRYYLSPTIDIWKIKYEALERP